MKNFISYLKQSLIYQLFYGILLIILPGNKISLDEELRDTIKIKTNLAAGTIRNTITSLVKKKMLLKDSRYKAVYYLNPEYFFKGKISDRTQIIKNIIEYKFIQ